MRLVAVHDAAGNIAALMTLPPNSPPKGMQVKAGQHLTEFEAPEITCNPRDPSLVKHLTEIADNFRLETRAPEGRFVRKVGAEASS